MTPAADRSVGNSSATEVKQSGLGPAAPAGLSTPKRNDNATLRLPLFRHAASEVPHAAAGSSRRYGEKSCGAARHPRPVKTAVPSGKVIKAALLSALAPAFQLGAPAIRSPGTDASQTSQTARSRSAPLLPSQFNHEPVLTEYSLNPLLLDIRHRSPHRWPAMSRKPRRLTLMSLRSPNRFTNCCTPPTRSMALYLPREWRPPNWPPLNVPGLHYVPCAPPH